GSFPFAPHAQFNCHQQIHLRQTVNLYVSPSLFTAHFSLINYEKLLQLVPRQPPHHQKPIKSLP
ncbi:MAG: hypothetical protein ACI87N_000111, partial [Flavobacteriales bacterium]